MLKMLTIKAWVQELLQKDRPCLGRPGFLRVLHPLWAQELHQRDLHPWWERQVPGLCPQVPEPHQKDPSPLLERQVLELCLQVLEPHQRDLSPWQGRQGQHP